MFTNIKLIEFRSYPFLECFLAIIAKLNPAVFQQYQNLNIEKEDYKDILLSDDIHSAEKKLHQLFKDKLHATKLPVQGLKKITGITKSINRIYLKNKDLFEKNSMLYSAFANLKKIESKSDLIKFIEEIKNIEISSNHKKMIDRAKRIVIIPSIYIYPQLGFNLIEETLYLLVGIKQKYTTNELDTSTLAACFSALSEPNRLEILNLIKIDKDIIAKEIANKLSLTTATVSHHLSTLAQASILSREKTGRQYTYKLEESRLKVLLNYLSKLI